MQAFSLRCWLQWTRRPTLLAPNLLVPLLALAGCTPSSEPHSADADKPLPTMEAVVWTVQPQPWPTVIRSQGSVVADEVAVVGAKVAGRVAEVHADLGDAVRAGEPLVTLDQQEFRLEVQQAEAQLAQARSAIGLEPDEAVEDLQLENAPPVRQEQAAWDEAKSHLRRTQQLQLNEVVTETELDKMLAAERVAAARYASALNMVREKIAQIAVRQAELLLARQRLREAVIAAPFDAMVQQREAAPGAYVHIGDPLVTLVRTNPLRFRGTVPERHAQQLTEGQEIRLLIESVAEPRTVTVTRISPAVDPLNRSLLFEARLDNAGGQLRAGLFAEAEIVTAPQAQSLAIPHSSLVEFAGAEKVWKVVDGVSTEQEVLSGQRRASGIEILDGLVAGDVILLDASNGQLASIQPLTDSTADNSAQKTKAPQVGVPNQRVWTSGGEHRPSDSERVTGVSE